MAAPQPDHEALRLWLRLLGCHNLIEARLRNALRTQFETTLPRFDLMAQLERHPEGVKMRDLSKLLMVTGGNITGLTDRLEAEGLLERRDNPKDRRAYYVALTPKGRTLFRKMAVQHEQWVIGLFEQMSARDISQLSNLLSKLRHQLAGEA